MKPATLRFAVVGASRGKSFIKAAESSGKQVKLVAMCDSDPEALLPWKDDSSLRCYTDYDQVLNDPEIDAVCLATPMALHAHQAIAALNAGKHVLSEVIAIVTIEEGWDLIAAVERTGLTYMMSENFCYMAQVLMVQNMVEQGVFGDLVYASGSYIHDCRNLYLSETGDLTWRGHLRREWIANSYPTHSLGPVARWLGINRTDLFKTTATWQSSSRTLSHYAKRNHPERPEHAEPSAWKHPDTVTTCIRTGNGALIDLRVDAASARPHHMTRYELQGTRASFSWPDSPKEWWESPMIWIEGRSPANALGIAEAWEPLTKYREEFEHPLWREHREQAQTFGHGGGDFFTLREFCGAIEEQRPPMIDVYDAVTWSCITPLSRQSIANENAPVEVPNFKTRANRGPVQNHPPTS